MKRLFFLILGSVLLCSSALGADNSQPGKKAKKVGMLTAYYAAETIELNYREYQKGQLIWESNDPNNRIVGPRGLYRRTGCSPHLRTPVLSYAAVIEEAFEETYLSNHYK